MELMSKLLEKINNSNYEIINQLGEIIIDNKFTTLQELEDYETKCFTIKGKVLNLQERINYCEQIYNAFPCTCDNLLFAETQKVRLMEDRLEKLQDDNAKIKLLIILFAMANKSMYFMCEAYKYIINGEL